MKNPIKASPSATKQPVLEPIEVSLPARPESTTVFATSRANSGTWLR